jgi:hypothetical protein
MEDGITVEDDDDDDDGCRVDEEEECVGGRCELKPLLTRS